MFTYIKGEKIKAIVKTSKILKGLKTHLKLLIDWSGTVKIGNPNVRDISDGIPAVFPVLSKTIPIKTVVYLNFPTKNL